MILSRSFFSLVFCRKKGIRVKLRTKTADYKISKVLVKR